jgi:predicted CXXCH cytochrome family protein
MALTTHLVRAALAAAALSAAGDARAQGRLAPLPQEDAVSTHGPFEMGECGICHDPKDAKSSPGRLLKAGADLCFDCHEDFKGPVKNHPKTNVTATKCTGCHSPHNSRKRKLLL